MGIRSIWRTVQDAGSCNVARCPSIIAPAAEKAKNKVLVITLGGVEFRVCPEHTRELWVAIEGAGVPPK